MDESRHTVTLPIEDYMALIDRPAITKDGYNKILKAAQSWGVNRINDMVVLAMTSQIPNWDSLDQIVIFDKDDDKTVLKAYRLVEIGGVINEDA